MTAGNFLFSLIRIPQRHDLSIKLNEQLFRPFTMDSFQTLEQKKSEPTEDRRKPTIGGPNESVNQELQKKIQEAFEVFDHEHNNTVDVREIGTIIRSLGFCPSEGELQEILREMEDPQSNGYIHIDRFYTIMTKIFMEHRFPAAHADILLKAFEILDRENKGFLTADEVRQYFTQHGEIFGPEETEELMNAALDPVTKTVQYKTFLHYLTTSEDI